MWKKTLTAVLLTVLLALAGAGCGTQTETGEAAAQKDDYSLQAQEYLQYIGTNLKDRRLLPQGEKENAHGRARDWIVSELKRAGYSDAAVKKTAAFTADDGGKTLSGENIEVTIPGRDPSRQVIAGAHYDGDGLGDNGSGVALLLANLVGLSGRQPLYTVKCVFFDGEENGLFGSEAYAKAMSEAEVKSTVYMVNIDAIAFGDYCNLYGGVQNNTDRTVNGLGAYQLALEKARALGAKTYTTGDLDGYFAKNGKGPEIEAGAFYTNPWTYDNPPPGGGSVFSPSTLDVSDQVGFKNRGIEYVAFEATNWYAEGVGGEDAYTGYADTGNADIGESGMFMNTEYDTLENLQKYFPQRAAEHFKLYSPLLSSLLLNPASAEPQPG